MIYEEFIKRGKKNPKGNNFYSIGSVQKNKPKGVSKYDYLID